ncbi:Protein argonaute 5 [Striga hermonthica]|uniref:Protein argonaute 5 n=1 Tax=Striga hermonthica TaxID=68872 RepID=A0A9N7MV75_STRHE|nr:Protein argonaute 5 [Striga hermonthica]
MPASSSYPQVQPAPSRPAAAAPQVRPASSLSGSASPYEPTPASPTAGLSAEMAQKLTVSATPTPVSSKALRPPARPGIGRLGKSVLVKANHFLVSVADRDLTHYDVSISPEVSSKPVCRKIMNELVNSFKLSHLGKKTLAYDGRKSCYAAGELPFTSKDFIVKLVDTDGGSRREREFKVSIKFASKADLHHLHQFIQGRQLDVPQETLQFLDVVLRQNPSNSCEVVGRSFFSRNPEEHGELGNGINYWKGFYQSLRPTQMGLSLNIDMSARAFYESILVTEFVCKYLNRDLTRPLSDQDRLKVKRALKGVRVEMNHQGHIKRHKISGLSTEPTRQLMFHLEEAGTDVSVADYYRQKYNIVLKYPFLPALQSGTGQRSIYLPMELCKIVDGQRYSKKLNERQVTALLRATCQRPNEREKSINKVVVSANNYNSQDLVTEFGINVDTSFTTIEARVLPPPMLKYHETGRESRIEPRVGQWNMIDKVYIIWFEVYL